MIRLLQFMILGVCLIRTAKREDWAGVCFWSALFLLYIVGP